MNQLVVETTHGPVRGFRDDQPVQQHSSALRVADPASAPESASATRHESFPTVTKWLGIPYASAGRFERPRDPPTWTATRDCYEFGTMFPQPPGMTEQLLKHVPGFVLRDHIRQSEHSHSCNVFVPPDFNKDERLPVMVFIYGGALNTGSSDRFFYDPTSLVRSQRGASERCIVVTGNYRVNLFGFLASKQLSDRDPEGLSGNYGLYDVVKLFEWVQANIAKFGGDPERVTAFGQSAGAFLISYLLVSGKRLFQRAILQSGAQKTMGMRPDTKSYPAVASIVETLASAEGGDEKEKDPVSLLLSASTDQLLSLHTRHHSLESVSLTIEPTTATSSIWNGRAISRLAQGDIDPWIESIVIGTTEHEGSVFALGAGLTDPHKFERWIERFKPETAKRARDKYLVSVSKDDDKGTSTCPVKDLPGSRLLADQIFVNPVWDLAKSIVSAASSSSTAAGGEKKGGRKVWMYRLRTGVEAILKNSPVQLGIMHSMDLPLVFNCDSLWNRDETCPDAKTARAFGQRWLQYAVTGQPDSEWKPFDPEPREASWLVFEHAGRTENEPLTEFELNKLELVVVDKDKDDDDANQQQQQEEGDEVLGVEFLFFASPDDYPNRVFY